MKLSLLDKTIWLTIIGSLLVIVLSYMTRTSAFSFKHLEVVESPNGIKLLKIHRVLKKDAEGLFILSLDMINDGSHDNECTVTQPRDILEAVRRKPFKTRFLSRFKYVKCRSDLKPGEYTLTVTYVVDNVVYSKTVKVVLTKEDLKWDR